MQSPMAILFNQVKNDDLDSMMPSIIENDWFNVRFPRAIEGMPPMLTKKCPILCAAAYFGSMNTFTFLLSNKADITVADEANNKLIDFALAGAHLPIIQELDSMGLIVQQGESLLLHKAVEFNNVDVVKYLFMAQPCDLNAFDTRGYRCLHYAAINANLEMAEFLVECGAAVNGATKNDGRTPLHCAASQPNPAIVEFFLSQPNIDTAARTDTGETALVSAARPGYVANLQLLLPRIDVNVRDNNGRTALHEATLNNKLEAVVCLLAQPTIDISIEDSKGYFPVFDAIEYRHTALIDLFLKQPNVVLVSSQLSALHIAAATGQVELCKTLVEQFHLDVNAGRRCKVYSAEDRFLTPIEHAAKEGHIAVLEYLITIPGRIFGDRSPQFYYNRSEYKPESVQFLKDHAPDLYEEFVSKNTKKP